MNPSPPAYSSWRRERHAWRLAEYGHPKRIWNNLISVVVFPADAVDATAELNATLRSLLQQTFRNIEVLVTGGLTCTSDRVEDFASFRGLFFEPELSELDFLRHPGADSAWRGSYLMLAAAGTLFDTDAFATLNAALHTAPGTDGPDLVLCDHDRVTGEHEFSQPSFTPGWDPDLIQSHDYIRTAFIASRVLVRRHRAKGTSFANVHEWLRRVAEKELRLGTRHVTETLVHLPQSNVASPPPVPVGYAPSSAVSDIAVIIPNRNRADLLTQCLTFMNLQNRFRAELVIVDNASDDPKVLALYARLREYHGAKIVSMNQEFNFSRMINLGVKSSTSPVLLLLNNDVRITVPGLVEQMVAQALRPEVGVVGTKLLYGDGTVQHGGMLLKEGHAGAQTMCALHVLRGAARADVGYLNALSAVRNYQAVTGALMASRREVFMQVGGFDEVHLPVSFNDVDYCLRLRKASYRVLCLPLDGIFHFESATRGSELSPEVARMEQAAMAFMAARWREEFRHDPYRNPWVELGDVPRAWFPRSGGSELSRPPCREQESVRSREQKESRKA